MDEQTRTTLDSLALALEDSCQPGEPEFDWQIRLATTVLGLISIAIFWFFTFFILS
ncbi:MAG: hypothetical protein HQM09_20695 [Candidatus Riflebacteria bacterium]|nr:hypothetical protein [Candidatus Riflebacteria bacterium]